jgi:hypothetical protein
MTNISCLPAVSLVKGHFSGPSGHARQGEAMLRITAAGELEEHWRAGVDTGGCAPGIANLGSR